MTGFHYHSCFIITVIACLILAGRVIGDMQHRSFWALCLFLYVSFCMGMLPVDLGGATDRSVYARGFINLSSVDFSALDGARDILFVYYQKSIGFHFDCFGFFVITAFIYTGNHLIFARKTCREFAPVLFLMFVTSLSFYAYGVNTIRAGLAASFLLLAIAYYKRIFLFFIFAVIAVNIHSSMLLPSIAMLGARFWNKPKVYISLWGLCVIMSAISGSFFEELFSRFMPEEKAVLHLNVDASETAYKVGFRLDFILYSILPIFAGYYYIVRRGIRSEFYSILLNTYILANCFWILVIRANYSDRFAYLSWFLYPIVLVYPLLKFKIWRNQNIKLAGIVLALECFTYFMFLR